VDWHGKKVVIQDAWVEHKANRIFTIVIVPGLLHFPLNSHTPGYYIGVTIKEGWDVLWGYPDGALLYRKGEGHSFMVVGRIVLSEEIADYDGTPIEVLLTNKPTEGKGIDIVFERE
jgi:hypothetical protein